MDQTDKTPIQVSNLISRRQCLRMLGSVPLVAVFGLSLSPIARFLKPTMQPFNFLQPADPPCAVEPVRLADHELQNDWDCVPFTLAMRYVILGPKQEEIREIRGFAIRVPGEGVVAYSRICTRDGGTLNYFRDSSDNCGCAGPGEQCCCTENISSPVLVCPRDHSVFDLTRAGIVIAGPAPWPARRFDITKGDGVTLVTGLPQYNIASFSDV